MRFSPGGIVLTLIHAPLLRTLFAAGHTPLQAWCNKPSANPTGSWPIPSMNAPRDRVRRPGGFSNYRPPPAAAPQPTDRTLFGRPLNGPSGTAEPTSNRPLPGRAPVHDPPARDRRSHARGRRRTTAARQRDARRVTRAANELMYRSIAGSDKGWGAAVRDQANQKPPGIPRQPHNR